MPYRIPEREAGIYSKALGSVPERLGRNAPSLVKQYGQDLATSVQYAEPFEIADYGRRPNEAEMEILFPMLTGTHVVYFG